jgi:hypothetical protein
MTTNRNDPAVPVGGPPGMYPVPGQPTKEREWDGEQWVGSWTPTRRPMPANPAQPATFVSLHPDQFAALLDEMRTIRTNTTIMAIWFLFSFVAALVLAFVALTGSSDGY